MSFFPDPAAVPYNIEAERGDAEGLHLDLNFQELVVTINQLLTCVQLIERDDGIIRNQSCTADAFDSSALALIAGESSGPTRWIPQGPWITATAYEATDLVETGSPLTSYVCVVAHVSGTFAVDHAAGKWIVLSAPRTLISADIVAALGFTPVNKAGDTMTGPLIAPDGTTIAGLEFTNVSTKLTRINGGLYSNFSDTSPTFASGFRADIVRPSGFEPIIGVQLRAFAGASVDAFGFGGQSIALAGNTTGILVAGATIVSCYEPDNASTKIGQSIYFEDRLNLSDVAGAYSYALPTGTLSDPGGGLSTNRYNKGAVALKIDSQYRSAIGEYCGWTRGIKFGEYAFDSEFDAAYTGSRAYPIGIDFSEMHYYGGVDPVIGFNMEAAIALRDQQIWWNRDPSVPIPGDKVKTGFDSFNGRLVTTLQGIEKFGIDVNAGTIYLNGVLFATVSTSANNVWTGTNTFNNTVTIGANEVFTGNGRRIRGDMTSAPAVSRLSMQTSVAASATEFQVIPSAGGGDAGVSVFTDSLVASGQFGRMAVGPTEVLFQAGRLGGSAYPVMVFNTSGADQMTLDLAGALLIGTASAPVTGAKLRVNGIIQCDNPVAFSVNRAGSNYNVAHDTITQVGFSTEAFDTNNNFDTGTGRFTPPAGYYHMSGCVSQLGAVAEGIVVAILRKNGTAIHNGSRVSASTYSTVGSAFSVPVYASGTDYFDLAAYQANPTSTTLSFAGNAEQCYFAGYRVG